MKRRPLLITLAIGYALVRWALLLHPGYVADMNAYKRWALRASQQGIAQVYATSDMDYPPLYAWILAPLGTFYGWTEPRAARVWTDPAASVAVAESKLFNLLVKFPPLVFDLGIAGLLYRLGRRADSRPTDRSRDPRRGSGTGLSRLGWTIILPAAYLLNPAVLMDVAYWGAPDSIHSFFVLAAFLVLGFPGLLELKLPRRGTAARSPGGGPSHRSVAAAWIFLTLATLMKPLGAPFFPLLLLLTVVWRGWRSVIIGGLAALATALVVFAPFLISGQIGSVFQRVVGDVTLMPFTSSNAHNLWWALGAWKPADNPVVGPLSLTHLGLAAFGACYLALLLAARRDHALTGRGATGPAGILLALGIAFAFFMLSTHLHENHLFLAIPLALALLPYDQPGRRAFALLAGALTIGVFLNLALHDLVIPTRFPFTLGGPTAVMNQHLKRPFYAGELAAIRFAVWWNLVLFGAFLWAVLRRGGLLARLAATRDP